MRLPWRRHRDNFEEAETGSYPRIHEPRFSWFQLYGQAQRGSDGEPVVYPWDQIPAAGDPRLPVLTRDKSGHLFAVTWTAVSGWVYIAAPATPRSNDLAGQPW